MPLKYPNKVRRILKMFGYSIDSMEVTIRAKLIVFLSFYFCVQPINRMVKNWDNLTIRFISIEHFLMSLIVTMILIQYTFNPKSVFGLLELVEEDYFKYDNVSTDKVELLKRKTTDDINFGVQIVDKLLALEYVTLLITPIVYVAYDYIFTNEQNETGNQTFQVHELPLPLSYGQECENLLIYILVYTSQALYLYGGIQLAYCFNNSCTFAIRRVTSDASLFTIILTYLNHQHRKYGYINQLHRTMYQVITHHTDIYRKCVKLNENIGVTITVINYTLTFLICVFIYSFVKANNTLMKCKYMAQIIVSVILLYIYSIKGQELRNESENMYRALADFPWIDKPQWFKKCLLIMLTRAQTRLEVKPFGLYVVDLSNFAKVMNAGYSYFNLFNNLS